MRWSLKKSHLIFLFTTIPFAKAIVSIPARDSTSLDRETKFPCTNT